MQFYKGMDVSMLKELEEHGAKYAMDGKYQDVFHILKECGVNLIRLRIWNDPYDEKGQAYGGGTNDLKTTIMLAKRIVENGIGFMLDFHYSDFWTDPSKQIKPKAWDELSIEQLKLQVYDYTKKTLDELKKEEIYPEIVQVGNEITKGFLWPEGHIDNVDGMALLLEAGINAVKDFDNNIKVLLHLDYGTDNAMYQDWFSKIEKYNLNFDMIGMSYYPYWNGSMDELLYNMNDISSRFDKDIVVAETAMGYTTSHLECNGMIFAEELEMASGYSASEEGQYLFLKDLSNTIRRVNNQRGKGFIYWEATWLPIKECTWASRIGCEYIHDKGEIGNSWANQALFNRDGEANQALREMQSL